MEETQQTELSDQNEVKTEISEQTTPEDDLQQHCNKVVMPGETIGTIKDTKIRLGPGLAQNQQHIVATKSGILRNPTIKYYWVENFQKRYVPSVEDMVIGVVKERYSEHFKVDIASAFTGVLSTYNFEGATKKNKPNLKVGSVVYCRVIIANKDMEPELSCLSARNKAEGYGELEDGFLFKTPISQAYSLLRDDCWILSALGRIVPYEIAVGMNGRVWIKSGSNRKTILLSNAILNSENMTKQQMKAMIAKLASHLVETGQ